MAAKPDDLITEFSNYLRVERGLSDNSIFSYLSDINKLDRFLTAEEHQLAEVGTSEIKAFLREETKKNLSTRTRARVIASLRQFYNYLVQNSLISENPMQNIDAPRIEKKLPDFLTVDEIRKLFSFFDMNHPLEARDRTMFELLYSCGLRISESVNLKLSDIDTENMFLNIVGKGGRERLVPFGEVALELIEYYQKDARARILRDNTSPYLFVSKKGGHLSRKSAWRLLKKYIDRAGIEKNITPHTLRHSFATHLLQNNADLRSVQELLGHIDISTTQVYTHLAANELSETHEKFHPRS